MIAKIEAEFESIDLAERASRVIRAQTPNLTAIYIRPSRSAYSHSDEWSWTPGFSGGGENGVVIRELLPDNNDGDVGFFPRGWNRRADGPDVMDSESVREPDLIRSALISCLADEGSIQEISAAIRNLGGLNLRIFY